MEKVLLKDIIIPAGTIFREAPVHVERAPGCFVEAVFGLSKDTVGYVTYEVDSEELKDFFADVK